MKHPTNRAERLYLRRKYAGNRFAERWLRYKYAFFNKVGGPWGAWKSSKAKSMKQKETPSD